ncbi:BTAD domain-containing putative transcriptional regulator [Nonomuraea spiralis]|uniref:BTAD domain-containing putative transcriptional regulator n=1 Tax=Nonomuraea spiralis TaxID=46182 RepID=A0ABV5IYI7_9ACTN|nr:BTAD domain-containing putative transcriptional regulator [Nonomuraea spiralis]GGS88125.1 regulatory protein AfsR [Nonomuraea spiralis]
MIDGIGIRLLGPVTGVLGDAEIDLGAARQRAVIAMLASPPGRVVTKGRLVEGLWGDDAPASAEQSVYTYVAGLRRALEPGREPGRRSTVLVGEAGGYRLLLAPRQVDSCLFTELVEEARLLDPGRGDDALRVLEQALSLWRGVALSGLAGPFAEAERSRLEQLFLGATEARAETLLRLGRQREAITTLQDLVGRHPLRERLHELLVLALHGADRQAEALLAYERARRTLDEELGVLPGEGLRAAHRVVLSGGAEEPPSATTSVPRQLPRDLIGFVGRSEEVARLRSLLAPQAGQPHPVVAISGPPGVGKSALAVHVGHAVEDRFPDGQLAIALRGGTPGVAPLPAHEIAGRLLRGIGTSDEDIPVDVDEAAAMWRSRLHGRRLLVLLDDAAGLAQIRPFLGTPLGVSVLVTSRESFTAGDDCVQLRLRPLSGPESAAMLSKLAGDERVAADAGHTAALVGLCDGLPLALRIAGARLADHPEWSVGTLAGRLTDERGRLRELAAGDLAVRSSLSGSHSGLAASPRPLDRMAAGTLPLLGLLNVPDVTPETAAMLLGTGAEEAARALDRLADAHLIDRPRPGRYQLHDLVRLFAGELRPEDWKRPLARTLAYLAASTRLSSVIIDPHRVQLAQDVDGPRHEFSDAEEAQSWLLEETHVLSAAAVQALNSADDEIAELGVRLTFALKWHQQRARATQELIELNTLVLRVCARLGDEKAALISHDNIANGMRLTGRTEEAVVHLEAELELATRLGDDFGELRALGNLANAYVTGLRFEEALPYAERQLAVARAAGSQVGVRFALLILGMAHHGTARAVEASRALMEGLVMAQEAGDITHEGLFRLSLGEVLIELDDAERTLEHIHAATDILNSGGYRFQVRGLVSLSKASRVLGKLDDALDYVTQALDLIRRHGFTTWEQQAEAELAAVRAAMRIAADGS